MVVCAIMVVIAGVVMANQSKFGGQVLLQNFAYDVALSLRQAQVYGISVQQYGTGGFRAGYGIHIDRSTSDTRYILFADSSGTTPNGIYNGPTQDQVRTEMTITRGYRISKLCVPAGSNADSCEEASMIDVVFMRPEPDALISWRESGRGAMLHTCLPDRDDCGESARIVMLSPRGDTMSITVSNNGQIAVDQVIANN